MEYTNEATLISIQHPLLEMSYYDEEKRIFFVRESRDGGETWVTVRQYNADEVSIS